MTAALLLAASVCTAAAHAAEFDTLRYGVEAQYPPFESKAASGELQGLDIDVDNAVCATAKMKCVWVETWFDGLIPALQGRKFNAINSAMNATDQRRQAIDFTTLVYRVPTQLIVRTGSGLEPTPASLKGKNIGMLQGSIQESFAKAHWANAGVNVVPYQDQNQAYRDLKADRLDGYARTFGSRTNGLLVQTGRRRDTALPVGLSATTKSWAAALRSAFARATMR